MYENGHEQRESARVDGGTGRTGRSLRRLSVLVPMLVFLSVSSAQAHEDLEIHHQSPPGAIEGTDVELVVAARKERAYSLIMSRHGPITVTAYYRTDEGTETVSTELSSSGGAARLTIPGAAVTAPMLRYWITAKQRQCNGAWSCYPQCEDVEARAPEEGVYVVPVQSPALDQVERPGRRSPQEIAKATVDRAAQIFERLINGLVADETPYIPGRGFGTLDEEPFEVPETVVHAPALQTPTPPPTWPNFLPGSGS